jgi:hypothetical protein
MVLMRIMEWNLGNCIFFVQVPTTNPPTQHDQHMGQMILSEASIIIIWTYQDRME